MALIISEILDWLSVAWNISGPVSRPLTTVILPRHALRRAPYLVTGIGQAWKRRQNVRLVHLLLRFAVIYEAETPGFKFPRDGRKDYGPENPSGAHVRETRLGNKEVPKRGKDQISSGFPLTEWRGPVQPGGSQAFVPTWKGFRGPRAGGGGEPPKGPGAVWFLILHPATAQKTRQTHFGFIVKKLYPRICRCIPKT